MKMQRKHYTPEEKVALDALTALCIAAWECGDSTSGLPTTTRCWKPSAAASSPSPDSATGICKPAVLQRCQTAVTPS